MPASTRTSAGAPVHYLRSDGTPVLDCRMTRPWDGIRPVAFRLPWRSEPWPEVRPLRRVAEPGGGSIDGAGSARAWAAPVMDGRQARPGRGGGRGAASKHAITTSHRTCNRSGDSQLFPWHHFQPAASLQSYRATGKAQRRAGRTAWQISNRCHRVDARREQQFQQIVFSVPKYRVFDRRRIAHRASLLLKSVTPQSPAGLAVTVPGTFDPIWNRGSLISDVLPTFDHVIIAVAASQKKGPCSDRKRVAGRSVQTSRWSRPHPAGAY